MSVLNKKNGNVASIDRLENGKAATISMLASKNENTGVSDLAVVYRFEDGTYVESVILSGDTTTEFTITPDNVPE